MLAGGARRGSGDLERAPAGPEGRGAGAGRRRDTALLGSLCPERASRLGSLPLRPSVGASRLSLCVALCAGLRARSTASLRPPSPLLNPLLPSQRASSLICRTTW